MWLLDINGFIDVIEPVVRADGFCISNKDKSVWYQSHMLCFYGDTFMSVALFVTGRFA